MSEVDSDGYIQGYMTKDGKFLGYHATMTMVPDLVPAKFHVPSGTVQPTGHSRTIPKGGALITDEGFGGSQTIVQGMVEDKGEGFAPSKVVPAAPLPAADDGPEISPELAAVIAKRQANAAAGKDPSKPEAKPTA